MLQEELGNLVLKVPPNNCQGRRKVVVLHMAIVNSFLAAKIDDRWTSSSVLTQEDVINDPTYSEVDSGYVRGQK